MPRTSQVDPNLNTTRFKYSTFFITVNTNQRDFNPDTLRSAIDQIFSNDDMFNSLLTGDTSTIDVSYSTVHFSVSAGPKHGFIHAHILVKIRHHSFIKFNLPLLRKVLATNLHLPNIHLDLKGFGESSMTVLNYIENQ